MGIAALAVLFGLLGCAFPACLFESSLKRGTRQGVSVGMGLVSILVSFVFLLAALLVVNLKARGHTLLFGCVMVGTFLAFWGVESIKALHAVRAADGAEGKDEQ